jgi:hypothetical protein
MKTSTKISFYLLASLFSLNLNANYSPGIELRRVKILPSYIIDTEKKEIRFLNVCGHYIIDDVKVNVLMEGDIDATHPIIDLSLLKTGSYLLEFEYDHYIYTEEIVIN